MTKAKHMMAVTPSGTFTIIKRNNGLHIRLRSVISITLTFLIVGCASLPEATVGRDQKAKKFQPPAGMAQIYVYRGGLTARVVVFDLLLNERNYGSVNLGGYQLMIVRPGGAKVTVITQESRESVVIPTQADTSYFLEVLPQQGTWKMRASIDEVNAAVGREAVAERSLLLGKADER